MTKTLSLGLLGILFAILVMECIGCVSPVKRQKHIMACMEPPCVKDNTYFECMDRQDTCLEDYLNNN